MIKRFLQKNIDIYLTLLLAVFYTVFSVIHGVKIIYINKYAGLSIDYGILFRDILMDWIIVVGFMQLIAISTKHFLNKKLPWIKIFAIHLVLAIVISFVIRLLSESYYFIIYDISQINIGLSIYRLIYESDLNFLIYFSMVSIIYSFYYYKQIRENEEQKAILKIQLTDAKMKMLTSQLQPHFLFNTLNCISSLIELNPKKAQDTLVDLSEFIREILNTKETHLITIHKEIHILNHYLNILRIRFSEDLIIKKNVQPSTLKLKMPALILQPLIENSIIHGYSIDNTELIVQISIYAEKEWIYLVVENNGKLMENGTPDLRREGMGISNINERLYTVYGTNYFFEIKNKIDGAGVENIIKIPLS